MQLWVLLLNVFRLSKWVTQKWTEHNIAAFLRSFPWLQSCVAFEFDGHSLLLVGTNIYETFWVDCKHLYSQYTVCIFGSEKTIIFRWKRQWDWVGNTKCGLKFTALFALLSINSQQPKFETLCKMLNHPLVAQQFLTFERLLKIGARD